jgi:hypothetical protein
MNWIKFKFDVLLLSELTVVMSFSIVSHKLTPIESNENLRLLFLHQSRSLDHILVVANRGLFFKDIPCTLITVNSPLHNANEG